MQSPGTEPRPWGPIPGPVDRTSFFEEQARHRRSTGRLSALCLLVVVIMALALSCIVGPLLLVQLAIFRWVLNLLGPLPGPLSRPLFGYIDLLMPVFQLLEWMRLPWQARFLFGATAALLPAWLPIVLIWFGLRAIFLRDGVGGVLLSLGARDPRPGDLEERQLTNIVDEMAIAAGLPSPRVLLLDSEVANAAVVGSGPETATIVISRRLLDEFNRDQTLGILGHLIGSVGNGDLRIAFTIASIYQTLGVLFTVLDAPFSADARADFAGVLRHACRPRGRDASVEGETLNTLLARSLEYGRINQVNIFMEHDPSSFWGKLDRYTRITILARVAFVMPLILANLIGKWVLLIIPPLLIGPLIALVWRSRRYLADATSVQLTRKPDGMADALIELIAKGGIPTGGQWAAHLFVVGTEVARVKNRAAYQDAIRRLDTDGAVHRAGIGIDNGPPTSSVEAEGPIAPGGLAEDYTILVNFHPPLEKRLQRLRALGATAR
ncbi:MAG TPA: M48 family metalloprotease [Chloroflexota bacterium]|nr:M48 family metalloprotease [Chloroflexota bacterium]